MAGISEAFLPDSSLLILILLPTGDMGGGGFGSSAPRILGFRSRFARALVVLLVLTGVGGATGDFTFAEALEGSFLIDPFSVGGKGEGDMGGLLLLAFFAFLLRWFSSSSDEPGSFSLEMLVPMDSMDAALKEGARFRALARTAGVANDSARCMRCTLGFKG